MKAKIRARAKFDILTTLRRRDVIQGGILDYVITYMISIKFKLQGVSFSVGVANRLGFCD